MSSAQEHRSASKDPNGLRAPNGRYLSVADDGFARASADHPGGWVVQETFRLEPHGGGHLLRHIATGGYVPVAAGGVKVAADGDVFSAGVVERAARGTWPAWRRTQTW